MGNASYRKRQRSPASCLICRRRKSKCDRVHPVCGSCKLKLIAHLCIYDDSPPVAPHYLATTYLPMRQETFHEVPQNQGKLHSGNALQPAPRSYVLPGAADLAHHQLPPLPSHQAAGHPLAHPGHPPAHPGHPPVHPGHPPAHPGHPSGHALQASPQTQPQPPVPAQPQMHPPQAQTQLDHHGHGLPRAPPHSYIQQPLLAPLAPTYALAAQSTASYDHSPGLYPAASGWYPHGPPYYGQAPQQYPQQQMVPHMVPQAPPELLADPQTTTTNKLPLPLLSLRLLLGTADTQASHNDGLEPEGHAKAKKHDRLAPLPSFLGTRHILDPQTYRMQQAQANAAKLLASALSSEASLPLKRALETPESDDDREMMEISVGGRVLQVNVDEVLDVFGGASNSLIADGDFWQQQGPLSYVAFTKGDPYIKMVRSYTIDLFRSELFFKYTNSNKARYGGAASEELLDTTLPEPFEVNEKAKTEKDEAGRTLVNEDALLVTKIKNKDESPDETSSAALFFELKQLLAINAPKSDYYNLALTSILRILPRVRAMKLAILRFFMYVYPFVPILHKETAMNEIEKLLTEPASLDDPYTSMNIKDDKQLNMAGQLVLMVRLGYMSLIPNVDMKSSYTDVQKALITDITRFKSDDYLNAVNLCISANKIQSKSTFKHVQGLTLLHYYRSVAPNDCLGLSGSDSSILVSSIVTHALAIGLNRDPTRFSAIELISKNPGFVDTWRSLWHYICDLDAVIAMYCGTPLEIPSLDISDVEKPEMYKSKYSAFFEKRAEVHECYRFIVKLISSVRRKPKVADIVKETSKLETLFQEMFGTNFFHEVICQPSVVNIPTSGEERPIKLQEAAMKVTMFTSFIQMGANLWCLYYLITLHYERKLDENKNANISAGLELFEMFFQRALQLVYLMSYSFDKTQELFGMPYDFMITAQLERSMIKTHIFLSSFFLRLLSHKGRLAVEGMGKPGSLISPSVSSRKQVVDSLFNMIMIESELFVGTFGKMSKTYVSSYRLHIMAYFVLKQCRENPEKLFAGLLNNKRFLHEGANLVHFLPTSAIEGVLRLCEEFKIAKLEQTKRLSKAYSISDFALNISTAVITPDFPPDEPDTTSVAAYDDGIISAELDSIFDAASANREMYAVSDFRSLHGRCQEKGLQMDLFDESSMAGYEEILKFFSDDGDFNLQLLQDPN